jgi:iron(III) transport system substrate-binding protein
VYVPADFGDAFRARIASADFNVEVVSGDSSELTDAIIRKQESPRADVLITSSVIDIWRASDQGALRPLRENALQKLPEELRDPDGTWVALDSQPLSIAITPGAVDVGIGRFEDLGASDFAGQLCLTTAQLPRNQVLVAMLIEDLGLKTAERAVRAWARNLAVPPFASDEELLSALRAGRCKVAIISGFPEVPDLKLVAPQPAYADIRGIGVARHARQPDAAHALVESLLNANPDIGLAATNGRNIGLAGWRAEEVRLLNERAGYR